MTHWDKIFVIIWLFVFLFVQAKYQAEYFAANKPAGRQWHFWQAVLFGIALTVIIPFWIYFGWWVGLKLLVIGIVQRIALYDPLLNIIRSKPFFYNGKDSTDSLQDKVENKLPSKWIIPLKIAYIILFIIAVIFIK